LDPEYNFGQASAHIRDAASQGASLAVLPEYHLTSWEPDDERFAKIALTAYEYVPRYQELAKECKINIVPGTIVTIDPASPPPNASNGTTGASVKPPALLNIAPFISYTGELLGSYTKANLWIPERPVLTSGPAAVKASPKPAEHHHLSTEEGPPPPTNPHSVIETPLGPVGIVICWDLAFPEACRALVRQGARLIIIPTFWTRDDLTPEARAYGPDVDILFLSSALITRSFENTCAIVFCNVGGPAEQGYAGISQVVLPLVGKVKGSFENGDPGMRIVECDMKTVDLAEENYKIREDLAGKDWHYGYSHA
jgi:predicted amidohydrolase